jgi:hypothetical protein
MLLYLPDELSVDEAKAIAVRVLAIAYEQEEAKLCARRSSVIKFRCDRTQCNSDH